MIRTKIFAVPSGRFDSVSLYRTMGPLSEMHRMGDIELTIANNVDWSTLAAHDIFFTNRPHTPALVKCISLAKACGKPVWVDVDDDLLTVPKDNKAFEFYQADDTRKSHVEALALADIVTVSTEALAEVVRAVNPNVVVIPNSWNERLLGDVTKDQAHGDAIMWRGSDTHAGDLLKHGLAFRQVALKYPEWKFIFAGFRPWMLEEVIPPQQFLHVQNMDPIDLFSFMREVRAKIMVVPLNDNEFNASKSNIAWLEATATAGSVVVAPKFIKEWRRPGVILYERGGLASALAEAIEMGDEARHKLWESSRKYVMNKLTTRTVNDLRKIVANRLYELSNSREWRKDAIERRGMVATVQPDDTQAGQATANQPSAAIGRVVDGATASHA